jgi:hypothetical protein
MDERDLHWTPSLSRNKLSRHFHPDKKRSGLPPERFLCVRPIGSNFLFDDDKVDDRRDDAEEYCEECPQQFFPCAE